MNKKVEEGWICSACLSRDIYLHLSLDISTPGTEFSESDWDLHYQPSILRAQTQTEVHHRLAWFSSLQTVDHGSSQPPKPCEPVPIINLLLYTEHIGSVSLENSNTLISIFLLSTYLSCLSFFMLFFSCAQLFLVSGWCIEKLFEEII